MRLFASEKQRKPGRALGSVGDSDSGTPTDHGRDVRRLPELTRMLTPRASNPISPPLFK